MDFHWWYLTHLFGQKIKTTNMKDTSLKIRGFISLEEKELNLRGGISWQIIGIATGIIASVIKAINTYKDDFIRGYQAGVAGKEFSGIKFGG